MALAAAAADALATARRWLVVAAARWAARLWLFVLVTTAKLTPAQSASNTTTPTIAATTLLILILFPLKSLAGWSASHRAGVNEAANVDYMHHRLLKATCASDSLQTYALRTRV
jgi:hypothetical protein